MEQGQGGKDEYVPLTGQEASSAPQQQQSAAPPSSQGYPPQGHPPPQGGQHPQQPSYPPQGYPPPQGGQPSYPPQGYPPYPSYPPQGYPPPQFARAYPQGYPPQGYPPHGYPPQGHPSYPPQGYPPPQGYGPYPPQYPQQQVVIQQKETAIYLGGAPVTPTMSAPVHSPIDPGKFFSMVNSLGRLMCTVKEAKKDEGTPLWVVAPRGQPHQGFRYKDGCIVTFCNKVLAVAGQLVPGASVVQQSRADSANQKWEFHADGTIRIAGTVLCLDIKDMSTEPKSLLVVNPANGMESQKWKTESLLLELQFTDRCYLRSQLNGFVLQLEKKTPKKYTRVNVAEKKPTAKQQPWSLKKDMIVSVYTGKALTVIGTVQSGAKVMQMPLAGTPEQKWEFHKDGTVRVAGTDLCLDIEGEDAREGQPVHVWTHHGRANQLWKVEN